MKYGPLECEVRGGDGAGLTCVFLHGFGAPGDDLVPLAEYFRAPAGTRWVFPAAPLELGGLYGDARAWWLIDFAKLERDLMTGRDRATEIPDGLVEARAAVIAMLDALGAPPEKTVIGGFSQGAMLSLDVALHTERAFAGIVLMSGTLIAEGEWAPRMPARKGLKVFQSHGERDALLPFAAAQRLRALMEASGLDVTWLPFRGQHEIPPPVVAGVGDFLSSI
ncbi:MAG TPA: hypothetical protein VL463_02785 [Kofleriaceae bacterium]|nr:hypothetical protein [Kofleriaceae bacterium]